MSSSKLLFLLILFILVTLLYFAQHSSVPAGERHKSAVVAPISPLKYQKMLGVGINVDWMNFRKVNYYYFHWRSKGVNIPSIFKEKGFSNVRIRVNEDVTSNGTALAELDDIVKDCLKAGIIPIISYTADELRSNPDDPEAIQRFIDWWTTVAKHFRGTSYLLSYDLITETSGNIKDKEESLNLIYSRTIKAIREIDPYRIIFVTPANVSRPFALKYLELPNDPYLMVEWHIYAGGPKSQSGSEIYDNRYVLDAIGVAMNWSKEHNVPTWMGAWRANRYPKKIREYYPDGAPKGIYPLDKVMEFAEFISKSLQRYGIPYDINSDNKFFDIERLRWYPSQEKLLNVILKEYDSG